MTEKARCPTCGKALESSGADCPVCLLNLALATSSGGDEATPAESAADTRHRLEAGSRVGPYTIVRELGEGGMGIVYLAQQAEPIKRRVALKVIKHGMDTDQVVKRFEAERQALALMDHVAIARVYEAGETASGRPYFAMEFIDGESVTAYCDRKRLGTAQRLALFSAVCEGVQHAHRRGIIHRDIKPSNVLVAEIDGEPQPKIIDFGVAKATEQSLTEHSAMTAMGVMLGTPEYMSPEQAELAPFDIDTRTDVYSLGVLLYELLTGALPFDRRALQKAAFDEVRRQIREVQPSKPSTRISQLGEKASAMALSRHTDVSSLRRRLAGDLDLITMKALEKERDRRYGSPAELADDIRRHLANEPILARPPSIVYQLRKLAARNRLASGLVGVVVVLLIVGVIAILDQTRRTRIERDRATREAETADSVSVFLQDLFTSADPRIARGDEITVRGILDKGAGRVEADLADQPVVQARLMVLLASIYESLGLHKEALHLLNRSGELGHEVMETEFRLDVGRLKSLAWVHRNDGRVEEGLVVARQALARAEESLDEDDPYVADVLITMGVLLRDSNEMDEAREFLDRAFEVSREFQGDESAAAGWSLYHLGWLEYRLGRGNEADQALERACTILETALEVDAPGIAACLKDHRAVLQWLERFDEAAEKQRRVIEILERVLPPDHPDLAGAISGLASVFYFEQDYENAELHYRRALAIQEQVLGADHPDVGRSLANLGLVYRDSGKDEEAEEDYLRGIAVIEAAAGPDDPGVISSLVELAQMYQKQGRLEETLNIHERVVASRERTHGPEHPYTAGPLHAVANVQMELGRFDEALPALRRAVGIASANFPPESAGRVKFTINLARCYAKLGRASEGRDLLQETLDELERAGTRGEAMARTCYWLARLTRSEGNKDEADALLEQAIKIRKEFQADDHATLLYIQAVLWVHQGETAPALDALRRSLDGGYPIQDVNTEVDFAPLRGHPEFEALF